MANTSPQQRGGQGSHAAATEKQTLKDQQVLNLFDLRSVVKVTLDKFFDYPEFLKEQINRLFEPVTLVKLPTDTPSGLIYYLATGAEEKMFELFQLTDVFLAAEFKGEAECVLIHLIGSKR